MGPYRYIFEIFKGHEGAIAEEPVVGASEPVPVQHRASPDSVQNYLVHLRGYSGERGIGGSQSADTPQRACISRAGNEPAT